jgi:hypothetical protein
LGADRKKFERRSLPLFSNLFWGAPGKQNDAVPQGAIGVFPVAVTEHETGLHWRDTSENPASIAPQAHAIHRERRYRRRADYSQEQGPGRHRCRARFGLCSQARTHHLTGSDLPCFRMGTATRSWFGNSSTHLTQYRWEHDRFPWSGRLARLGRKMRHSDSVQSASSGRQLRTMDWNWSLYPSVSG